MKPASKNALGKGLAALMRESAGAHAQPVLAQPQQMPQETTRETTRETTQSKNTNYVLLALLRPGKFQPRQSFKPEAIAALAQSIKSSGMIQPILVRPAGASYEIIAGERRFRAAQQAQLHQVPVIIRETNDREALQIALIENLQRAQLNPVEEALAFQRLQQEFGHDHSEIAATIGKSRSYVANMVRLLSLPEKVREMMKAELLSAGHARALVVAADPETLAALIIKKNLSVRAAEQLAADAPRAARARAWTKKLVASDVNTRDFIQNFSRKIGLSVALHENKAGGGELRIRYRTLDQIEELIKKLGD